MHADWRSPATASSPVMTDTRWCTEAHPIASLSFRWLYHRGAEGTIHGNYLGNEPTGSARGSSSLNRSTTARIAVSRCERVAREVYCGAIGFIGFGGRMDMNIAIRTVTINDNMAVFHAGGGSMAMSDPEAEYEETPAKAQRIFDAFRADTSGAT